MIRIEEARAAVLAATPAPTPDSVPVGDALGRFLVEDVTAALDAPRFDNAAMDGFAALAGPAGRHLELIGESRAGAPFDGVIGPGQAVRISTGAPVPAGADVGVLQVELSELREDGVLFTDDLRAGRNIRRSGEDVSAGTTVLRAGQRIGPAEIGVAINAGADTLLCGRRPTVAIVNTGDELVPAGAPLGPGQIHDSNGPTLSALAQINGAKVVSAVVAGDTQQQTEAAIEAALQADFVILSGGVSVGPHDHVKPALDALGVREEFWRVALKPGKPTWFGTRGERLVFGLPGNPVSTYVTFILFARPALRAFQGGVPFADTITARLATALPRHPGRDECVRVSIVDGLATPTGPQGSHVSSSLSGADGLALIPLGEGVVEAGAEVSVEPL